MLQMVEEKEKEKILNRAMGSEQEHFTKATTNYFGKLIRDALKMLIKDVAFDLE